MSTVEILGYLGVGVCPTDSIFPIMICFDHRSVTYSQSMSPSYPVKSVCDKARISVFFFSMSGLVVEVVVVVCIEGLSFVTRESL